MSETMWEAQMTQAMVQEEGRSWNYDYFLDMIRGIPIINVDEAILYAWRLIASVPKVLLEPFIMALREDPRRLEAGSAEAIVFQIGEEALAASAA